MTVVCPTLVTGEELPGPSAFWVSGDGGSVTERVSGPFSVVKRSFR